MEKESNYSVAHSQGSAALQRWRRVVPSVLETRKNLSGQIASEMAEKFEVASGEETELVLAEPQ